MSVWRVWELGADPELLEETTDDELPDELLNVGGELTDDPKVVEENPDDEPPEDSDNEPEGFNITVGD